MPRYTDAQRDQIRSTVQELYLLGYKNRHILRYLAEKLNVHLKDRQVTSYLEEVRKEIRETSKFDRQEATGKALERLDSLYRTLLKKEDERGALRVQREINLLQGLITHRMEHRGLTLESWLRGENAPAGATALPGPMGGSAPAGGADAGPGGIEGGDDDDDEPGRPTAPAGDEKSADQADLDADEGPAGDAG